MPRAILALIARTVNWLSGEVTKANFGDVLTTRNATLRSLFDQTPRIIICGDCGDLMFDTPLHNVIYWTNPYLCDDGYGLCVRCAESMDEAIDRELAGRQQEYCSCMQDQ